MKLKILTAILALAAFSQAGCARMPSNPTGLPTRTISFDITVAGRIDPNKYYFIALDTDQNGSTGPLPAVAPPWGNGWATGTMSHFVEYHLGQVGGNVQVYRVLTPDLLQTTPIGQPFEVSVINNNTLHVTLDIDSLGTAQDRVPAANIHQLEVNFITTDQIITDPTFPGPKSVDSLNNYVSIPVDNSRVFTPADLGNEPAGDMQVPNPDLDIVNYRIEVRGSR